MSIELTDSEQVSEARAVAEISGQGFETAARDYPAGKTEPHSHDYDVCVHIVAGQFRLGLVEQSVLQSFGPGERLVVPAGTVHFEDHGPVRIVVGRRQPGQAAGSCSTEGG